MSAKSSRWKQILTIVTFVSLIAVVWFSRHQIADTFLNLKNVTAWILIFMIFWQVLNYHYYTKLYNGMFKIVGKALDYMTMYRVAIEMNFVNHVFPSAGVAGFSYFSYRLKQFGISGSKSTLIQMLRFLMVFISFQILLLIGVVALALDGKANNFTILVASSIGTLLGVGTIVATYIVGNKSRINNFTVGLAKVINKILHILRPNHPETIRIGGVKKWILDLHEDYLIVRKNVKNLKKPLYYAFMANFTEIATVYMVFLAFGHPVNPGAVIIAYAVANFAGLISVLPGGIGAYEALMTGVLATAGVPPSIGLPATVMYRILSMAIQLPPGYYYYQKFLKESGIDKTDITK